MEEERKISLENSDKLCIVGDALVVPEALLLRGYKRMNYSDVKFLKTTHEIIVWSQN